MKNVGILALIIILPHESGSSEGGEGAGEGAKGAAGGGSKTNTIRLNCLDFLYKLDGMER